MNVLLTLCLAFFASLSFASTKVPDPSPSASASTTAAAAPVASATTAKVLWDSWYTVSAAGGVPYGYYNDRFERKGGKIAFKNQFWKREEGYINEEQVVAIASDDETLTPEFWNFHSSYRSTTLDIDGSFQGNILTAKTRQNTRSLDPIKHSVDRKTFLSVLFPVWISKKLPTMKPGRSVSFSVLFEDSFPNRFMPFVGSAKLESADDFAKKSGTTKIAVDIDGKKSNWYVLSTGEPLRIEMLSQKLRVEKVTEAIARRFLMEKPEPR